MIWGLVHIPGPQRPWVTLFQFVESVTFFSGCPPMVTPCKGPFDQPHLCDQGVLYFPNSHAKMATPSAQLWMLYDLHFLAPHLCGSVPCFSGGW